jgi:RNA polymerase sigma-70 factor (family 1)
MLTEPLHNEKQLLVQVSEGDGTAFHYLFERYYGMVYSVSLRYLKIHELAEDVAQQSFLKIWDKRDRLSNIDRFDAYLFMIARNEITDLFRKQTYHQQYVQRIRELFEEEENSPEELLITKQKRMLIKDAIHALPAQQQQAYRLSRDKGLSYLEIAEEMGLSVNTVRKHISVALNSIRAFFLKHKNELYQLIFFWFLIRIYVTCV